jgi:two-component system phosphate regulon sensor histidine kinase PhoR
MVVLPLSIYLVYEFSTINENEAMIEEIYKDQLKSTLFSVNQYSSDFLNAIFNKMEEEFQGNEGTISGEQAGLLYYKGFSYFDIINPASNAQYYTNPKALPGTDTLLNRVLKENQNLYRQLIQYLENDYRKIEPISMLEIEGQFYQLLVVMLKRKGKYFVFRGLIDPRQFTEEVMAPKMQEIGNQRLVITLHNTATDEMIYSTDTLTNNILVAQEMWIFPGFEVGVSPVSETVDQLVNQRLTSNLIAISILAFLLVFGFILIFRNLRQEILLAQTKSEFVSNVSHELRTPLSLISMFAETLLLDRVKHEYKKREYIEIIFKETNRLTNIVNRILNFSRIEANKKTYQYAQVELNSLLAEIVRDYSFHLEQNGFEYHLEHNAEEKIEISADKEAIYEAVVNLIDNAVKYSNEEKSITLRSTQTDDQAIIEIKDRGIGISKDKLDQIFDKFFRVSDRDIYQAQGAGLGLTIVRHIIDAHHGRVEVQSELNKGTNFKLIFPKNITHGKDSDR